MYILNILRNCVQGFPKYCQKPNFITKLGTNTWLWKLTSISIMKKKFLIFLQIISNVGNNLIYYNMIPSTLYQNSHYQKKNAYKMYIENNNITIRSIGTKITICVLQHIFELTSHKEQFTNNYF